MLVMMKGDPKRQGKILSGANASGINRAIVPADQSLVPCVVSNISGIREGMGMECPW